MQIIASITYLIFIAVYIFLIVSIASQVKKYLLPNDSARLILKLFITGSAAIITISFILFLLTPWNNYNPIFENFLNFNFLE